ncbi:MAG TPA: hypothetical protein VNZ43_03720 [Sphingomonadaceae bacterium]|nr:hypothetical protein [Sphingomonadaceae bacterium]
MYEADDPRARLATASSQSPPAASAFGASSYARFYDMPPNEEGNGQKNWYARGANFVLVYSEVEAGAVLARNAQVDEYVLLLPDADTSVRLETGTETQAVGGFTITMIPPGDSRINVISGGRLIRFFSACSADLAARACNAATYAESPPSIPPFVRWPSPVGGFKIRSYSLDVPEEPGRFGKIWRCSTFMVNVFPPQVGPRDPAKLSPHHHDDFEQCSLAIAGTYVHHLRWPWTANLGDWREDEHETCESPSICVIPPRVIHTSAAIDRRVNLLVDIFSPPRADFSAMAGWVLNAGDYPQPE